ncbi:MAG: glycosyltransferase family 39 protein [Acidobacteriota bacterium]
MRTVVIDPVRRHLQLITGGVCLGALVWVLLFWRIGAYPLTDGDAAYYGRIARNVVETREILVLRFDPTAPGSDVDKPPLVMWIMAGAFWLLGPTDVAARVWHGCAALAVGVATGILALRVAGPQAAVLAVGVLVTSGLFFYQAREPLLDIPLTLFLTAALALIADKRMTPSWRRLWGAAVLAGLGIMTKGPVFLALVIPPIAVVTMLQGQLRWPPGRTIVLGAAGGLVIILALVLPWHLWVYAKLGAGFFDMYTGAMSWRRYLTPVHTPGVPIAAYTGFALVAMIPWTGFVLPAWLTGWREGARVPALRFLCLYVLWAIVFFGVSPGRTFGKYLLPTVPALAVLVGRYLSEWPAQPHRLTAWMTLAPAVLLTALSGYAWATDPVGAGAELGIFLLCLACAMLTGGVLLLRGATRASAVLLAAGVVAAYVLLIALAVPKVVSLYPEREFARTINRTDGRRARVAVYRTDTLETMLAFYLDAPRVERLDGEPALERFLNSPEPGWVVERTAAPLPPLLRQRLEVVGRGRNATLLAAKGRGRLD